MEKFIEYIQESIKTIENEELQDHQKALIASRLDSICALLSITLYNLKTEKNENT
jgi:hypothetical protein